MPRPIDGLQVILKLNVQISGPISTLSSRASNRSTRCQLGGEADGENRFEDCCYGIELLYTRNRGVSVVWGFGVVGFPLTRTDDPRKPADGYSCACREKGQIALKLAWQFRRYWYSK